MGLTFRGRGFDFFLLNLRSYCKNPRYRLQWRFYGMFEDSKNNIMIQQIMEPSAHVIHDFQYSVPLI
jgi:hypothetical protein